MQGIGTFEVVLSMRDIGVAGTRTRTADGDREMVAAEVRERESGKNCLLVLGEDESDWPDNSTQCCFYTFTALFVAFCEHARHRSSTVCSAFSLPFPSLSLSFFLCLCWRFSQTNRTTIMSVCISKERSLNSSNDDHDLCLCASSFAAKNDQANW